MKVGDLIYIDKCPNIPPEDFTAVVEGIRPGHIQVRFLRNYPKECLSSVFTISVKDVHDILYIKKSAVWLEV